MTLESGNGHGLVCGIDLGSTNVKVTLVDGHASSVWTRSIAVPRVMQSEGPSNDGVVRRNSVNPEIHIQEGTAG